MSEHEPLGEEEVARIETLLGFVQDRGIHSILGRELAAFVPRLLADATRLRSERATLVAWLEKIATYERARGQTASDAFACTKCLARLALAAVASGEATPE